MSSDLASRSRAIAGWLVVIAGLGACLYPARDLPEAPDPLKVRSMQSRAFDTADRARTLRAIITALQDLGFIVDRADYVPGSVSGTKLDDYSLRMTVTVQPHGASQLLVQASARYIVTPVLDPGPYQQFFSALARALFLEAHQVD